MPSLAEYAQMPVRITKDAVHYDSKKPTRNG